jgi:hypothetical protein
MNGEVIGELAFNVCVCLTLIRKYLVNRRPTSASACAAASASATAAAAAAAEQGSGGAGPPASDAAPCVGTPLLQAGPLAEAPVAEASPAEAPVAEAPPPAKAAAAAALAASAAATAADASAIRASHVARVASSGANRASSTISGVALSFLVCTLRVWAVERGGCD